MLHGEPDAGNLHVRFEEGRVDRPSLGRPLSYSTGSWTYADYGSVVPGRNNGRGTQTALTSDALPAIIACMSRLRRLVVSDRWFFITCRLLPGRRILSDSEFATLAEMIDERRAEHGFLLTAWVFLPDHWHAIFYPRHPLTISKVMEAIKDGATKRLNRRRHDAGMLWIRSEERRVGKEC